MMTNTHGPALPALKKKGGGAGYWCCVFFFWADKLWLRVWNQRVQISLPGLLRSTHSQLPHFSYYQLLMCNCAAQILLAPYTSLHVCMEKHTHVNVQGNLSPVLIAYDPRVLHPPPTCFNYLGLLGPDNWLISKTVKFVSCVRCRNCDSCIFSS